MGGCAQCTLEIENHILVISPEQTDQSKGVFSSLIFVMFTRLVSSQTALCIAKILMRMVFLVLAVVRMFHKGDCKINLQEELICDHSGEDGTSCGNVKEDIQTNHIRVTWKIGSGMSFFEIPLPACVALRWAKSRDNYRRIVARVIAAIRNASVRWQSYLPRKHRYSDFCPHRPCVRCAAIRIAGLAFIRLTFAPRGTAEWLARVDRVRWTLAIGNWKHFWARFPNYCSFGGGSVRLLLPCVCVA